MRTFRFIFYLTLICSLTSTSCTTKTAVVKDEPIIQKKETIYEVWTVNRFEVKKLDTEPVLKGGDMSSQAVYKNFRYPAAARENGVEGKVEILVVVNEFGILESMELAKGIGSGCDEESLKSVENMKEIGFEPATLNGMPVKVRYIIPVIFRLG